MTQNDHHMDDQAQAQEISSFRLIITLGVAGFISGLVLVTVYLVTLPIIQANKAEALTKAIFAVLPGCETYNTLLLKDGGLVLVDGEESADQQSGHETENVFAGYDKEGNLIGFAIPGTEPGFQDVIGGIFGYHPGKEMIIGFEVLESKETPGLGDKIIKDEKFRQNFIELKVNPELVPVKSGNKNNSNEVEMITGATISSKAVIRLLQNSINKWKPVIENYISTNNISLAKKRYEAN